MDNIKSAAESHLLLMEAYGEYALSETTRGSFRRFKNNDFDVNDKERSGQSKKFEKNWRHYFKKIYVIRSKNCRKH